MPASSLGVAEDVVAAADALALGRFAVVGFAGGARDAQVGHFVFHTHGPEIVTSIARHAAPASVEEVSRC